LKLEPRFLIAGNAGPLTLDGTRTHLVGERTLVVIDAGPTLEPHMDAVREAVAEADEAVMLVTHGHSDHAAAARILAPELGIDLWGPRGLDGVTRPLDDGSRVATDVGDLIAVDTPGHARHHIGLHWPAARGFFAGDLLLGSGDTVWVGEYPGCVADYLKSLARVRALGVDVVYPAHGPPITDPVATVDRYTSHRLARIREMEALLAATPAASVEELVEAIYGSSLPAGLRRAVERSVDALKAHVEASA
jgi:glyoxylase-like metal-dependent hydrolase (beta-lactamase superfamily II)